METFELKATDGKRIPVALYPKEDPKGLLQIVHGSLEHKERYFPLSEFLNANGYAVILSDHRGHGAFVDEDYPKGHFESLDELIDDMSTVSRWIKEKYPEKPLAMLGHSLGSQLARVYLQEHDEQIQKLILTGTVSYKPFAWAGKYLCSIVAFFKGGWTKPSKLLRKVSGLDRPQEEWISYDRENLERKRKDPLFAKEFTIGGYRAVFASNDEIRKVAHYRCANPLLPILSLNGDGDFLTGYQKGLDKSMSYLRKAGYRNVSYKRYDHMLHEVLNESDRQRVYEDILAFLER